MKLAPGTIGEHRHNLLRCNCKKVFLPLFSHNLLVASIFIQTLSPIDNCEDRNFTVGMPQEGILPIF